MKEIRIEVWGFFSLNKKQILIFELFFLSLFIGLTIFLFTYDFKTHLNQTSYNFHAIYAKYFSLACTFLIIIEAQFLWSKFTQAQLELIKQQNAKIEKQNNAIIEQNAELKAQKEEILVQNEMLYQQKEEILEKQKKIQLQNKDIKDSIAYASRIQSTLLPSKKKIERLLDDYFIFFKPKDVVSGDFYWMDEYEDKIIISVADCTGHGVPGAFVSAMGISFLNEIVYTAKINKEFLTPAKILNGLRDRMLHSIESTESDEEAYDGMDISICIIDKEKKKYTYAGALLSIMHVSKLYDEDTPTQIEQLKPDVHPVSMMDYGDHSYKDHIIPYKDGDMIYLYTDGYADQFGGPQGRKFLNTNFRDLIQKISAEPPEIQEVKLETRIRKWQGNYEQIDDMTVIGIEL
jgi:serine phosphatase RsbU (regulator of sigma subunit)